MKNNLRRLIILCAMVVCFANVNAQNNKEQMQGKTPEQRVEMRVSRLKAKLNLSPDQESKLKDLILAQEKVRESRSGDQKEAHQQMITEIGKILTPDQMTKFKEIQEQNHEKMKGQHGKIQNEGNPPPPQDEK